MKTPIDDRLFATVLLAIMLVGILFRIWHFTPELGNDDQRWIVTSQELFQTHTSELPPVYYSRILWRSLLLVWGKTAGLSLTTTPCLMFGLSCLTMLMIALAGRLAFTASVGLWAAAIYATHPIAVVYDTLTLPDGLAVALLAVSLCLFLKFLQCERPVWLALCGLVVGLSFSAKEYFILTALPMAACLLLRTESFCARLRHVFLFSVFAATGIAADLSLHYWESGQPLMHFTSVSDYGERILSGENEGTHTGVQRLVRAVMARCDYLRWLFADMGVVSGSLTLWATTVMLIESKNNIRCLLLSTMTGTLFLFLFFCPATLHPFTFVEMQPRYLGILLPMVALGCGVTIAEVIEKLPLLSVRNGFLVSVLLGLISNVMVPNDLGDGTFNRAGRQQFDGIRDVLVHAEENGISELVLPDSGYRSITPDAFETFGPTINYYVTDDAGSVQQVRDRILRDSSIVVFIPRSGFKWPLVHALRRGEYRTGLEVEDSHKELAHWLEINGASREDVSVPDTVFMAWMSWAGLVSRDQQLVGWIYRQALR